MTLKHLLILAAIILFIIAAILAFTWFGTSTSARNVIGFIALGLACFAGSLVVPPSAP